MHLTLSFPFPVRESPVTKKRKGKRKEERKKGTTVVLKVNNETVKLRPRIELMHKHWRLKRNPAYG